MSRQLPRRHGLAVEVALEVSRSGASSSGRAVAHCGATRPDRPALRPGDAAVHRSPRSQGHAHGRPRPGARSFAPWDEAPCPPRHQVRGLFRTELWERDTAVTARVPDRRARLPATSATEDGRSRYGFDDVAGVVDRAPDARAARGSVGRRHRAPPGVARRRRAAPGAGARGRSRPPGARPTG